MTTIKLMANANNANVEIKRREDVEEEEEEVEDEDVVTDASAAVKRRCFDELNVNIVAVIL